MARIQGITIEIDGDTKKLSSALTDVNKRSRDIQKELRQVERLLKFNPKNADLLRQKQKLLGDQIATTGDKLKTLKSVEKDVQQQFKEGKISEEQYRAFQREIAETESKLKHYKNQLKDVKGFTDRLGEATQKAGKKLQDIGKSMKDAGKTMTTRVTAPILGLIGASAKIGSDFEASMSKVQAISGATGDDLEKLTAKAREMGATTQFSAAESADALNYMALAGWDVEQMLGGIDGVMALAAASGEDLAQVSDIVTDGLSAFGLAAEDSGRFADVLAAASANANTDVSGLGAAFQYVAPVAGALGFTIEDTATAIGLMSNAGIKGQKAGTALRTMMTNLAKPTDAMKKQMKELGISLTDSEGEMKSFDEIMRELQVSFKDLSKEEQAAAAATIFGKQAMSGALAIINTSAEEYDKLSASIGGSEGAAQDMADVMQDNLQGRLKEMRSALEEVAIVIYDNIQPALEMMIALVLKAAEWFQQLSPSMQNTILVIAGIAAAIGPLLIVLGMMAQGIGAVVLVVGKIIPLIGLLGKALMVLAANPVGLIITAIAALIAIGIALYKNWDTVKDVSVKVWGAIANFFIKTKDKIVGIFESLFNWLNKKTDGTFGENMRLVKLYMTTMWNNVKSILGFLKDTFKNAFAFLKALVTGDMKGMRDALDSQMKNVQKLFKNIFGDIINHLKNIDFKQLGINMIKGMINGIGSMASALINKAKGVVQGAVNGAKKLLGIRSPSRVFEEIGEFSGMGLEKGLQSMGGRVERASEDMSQSSIPSTPSKNSLIQDNSDVIVVLEKILDGIKDGKVIMVNERVLGEVAEPIVSEIQDRNKQVVDSFV